jgi:hypothetical protein
MEIASIQFAQGPTKTQALHLLSIVQVRVSELRTLDLPNDIVNILIRGPRADKIHQTSDCSRLRMADDREQIFRKSPVELQLLLLAESILVLMEGLGRCSILLFVAWAVRSSECQFQFQFRVHQKFSRKGGKGLSWEEDKKREEGMEQRFIYLPLPSMYDDAAADDGDG